MPDLPIGVALQRQVAVLGIGNVGRIEAMFEAKVHPKARVDHLTDSDVRRTLKAARDFMMYGNFDVIWGPFLARCSASQHVPPPHAPRAMLCFVAMLIGC